MNLKAILALCLAAAPTTFALGINCEGSSQCFIGRWAPGDCGKDAMRKIHNVLQYAVTDQGLGNRTYMDKEYIACHGHCCAFFQGGASGTVKDALRHINNLRDHGCKGCGSDPVTPGNDDSTGEFTVNWIQGGGRCEEQELCWPYFREGLPWETDTYSDDTKLSERAKAVTFEG